MNAFFQKISTGTEQSIFFKEYTTENFIKEFNQIKFELRYHFHSELELIFFVKGNGKFFISENFGSYEDGAMFMLGKNLQHGWNVQKNPFTGNINNHILLLQFNENIIGEVTDSIPEMNVLMTLFKNASFGLNIKGKTREMIASKMVQFKHISGLKSIIELMSLLETIANSEEIELILPNIPIQSSVSHDQIRINKVFNYINENFGKEISLEMVASLVNMSKSSFCHFFYKRTGKNFSQVVNEIRIKNACKLLVNTDLSIGDICYMNGYNYLSYFNKQFKMITNITPLKYKKDYIKFHSMTNALSN